MPWARALKIYAAANHNWVGKILVTADKGITWVTMVTTITPDLIANPTDVWNDMNNKITFFKMNPFDPKVMFRGTNWGLFRSNNIGINWFEKIKGAPNTVGSDIKFIGNDLFVATMDNGLLKSLDQGATYKTVFPLNKPQAPLAGHVWRVVAPSTNKIVATMSPWNEKVNQVIHSTDGGVTFTIVRSGLPLTRPKVNTMWGE